MNEEARQRCFCDSLSLARSCISSVEAVLLYDHLSFFDMKSKLHVYIDSFSIDNVML